MGSREFERGRRVVARLPYGGDLLTEIAAVAQAHGMVMAELRAIGALRRARLAYYDQDGRVYRELAVNDPTELVSLLGTVSQREGAMAVHAHATLATAKGVCVGGHVNPGCSIFACELVLQELVGETLQRGHDEQTGLPLWKDL